MFRQTQSTKNPVVFGAITQLLSMVPYLNKGIHHVLNYDFFMLQVLIENVTIIQQWFSSLPEGRLRSCMVC